MTIHITDLVRGSVKPYGNTKISTRQIITRHIKKNLIIFIIFIVNSSQYEKPTIQAERQNSKTPTNYKVIYELSGNNSATAFTPKHSTSLCLLIHFYRFISVPW